jgi:hypothetical protein
MMTATERRETEAFRVVSAERPAEYTSWLYSDNGVRNTIPGDVLAKVDAVDNKRKVREVIKLAQPLNGEEGKKIRHAIYCSADKGYAKIVDAAYTIIVLYDEKKAS